MSGRLDELRSEIIDHSYASSSAARLSVQNAIRCGECLLEARDLVGHGSWRAWVESECPFSYQSAVSYMRLARHADIALSFDKDIGVTAAIRIVMRATSMRTKELVDPTLAPEARRLRESGLSYSKIAEQLGISSSSVHRLLNPEAREAALRQRQRARTLARRNEHYRLRQRVGGTLGHCYGHLRRCIGELDKASREYNGEAKAKIDAAYALLYQAEDLIGEALRIQDAQASRPRPTKPIESIA